MNNKEYTKVTNIPRLLEEIAASTITIAVQSAQYFPPETTQVEFKADLSSAEWEVMDAIISSHVAEELSVHAVQEVKIAEEPIYATDIDRTYQLQGWPIDIPANDSTPVPRVVMFPYPIVLLGGDCMVRPDMIGDRCKCEINPEGLVGATVSLGSTGASSIEIDEVSAALYVFRGYRLRLGEHDAGRVTQKVGQTIYFENPLPSNLSAGSPVRCWLDIVPMYYFTHSPAQVEIGKNTANGAYIPAGIPFVFTYFPDNLIAKRVAFSLEYYF